MMFDVYGFDVAEVKGTIYLEWFDSETRYTENCPLATIEQLKQDKKLGFLTPPDIQNRIEGAEAQLASRFIGEGKTYDKEELREALELFANKYC